MTYVDKLKDPRWQKKRLKILERDNFSCSACHDNKHTLHVHHLIYLKDRDPWDYRDELLTTMCKDCHEFIKDVNLKDLISEHIFSYGTDKALRWFIKDITSSAINITNAGYSSIIDAYNEYSDWLKFSKNQKNG